MNQFLLCLKDRKRLGLIVACGLGLFCPFAVWGGGDPSEIDFFEKRIRPVLVERCYSCHSGQAQKLKAELRLDSRAGVLKGGEGGAVVVPGHPEQSRLIEAIHYRNVDLQMPPKGKLPDARIADLELWIKMGVPWPEESSSQSSATAVPAFDLQQRRRDHWAWHPINPVTPPAVKGSKWVRTPVDQFILSRLEQKQLSPAPAADRRTLLRRVCFDLIGLPPSSAETEAFLNDTSPEAYEKVVDRLLASPAFGERWARHWLDLVRYAETLGHEFDYPNANAWRYRDYVIRAFNADVPYDQFVKEHLAGDLIAQPRRNPADGCNESVIGTAFYWLGQRDHSPVDVRQHQAELIDNQIDVLSKAFLGLTVACARCHDHKFDALSAQDYYSLYGILSSSRFNQASIEPTERLADKIRRLAELKRQLRQAVGTAWLDQSRAAAQCLVDVPEPFPSAPVGLTLRPGDLVFADTASGKQQWDGWFFEGEAFAHAPAAVGDFVVGGAAQAVRRLLAASAWDSSLLSRRLQGTLRSPTFTITNRFVHILAAGRGARINLPVDNFTMIRDPIYGTLKQVVDSDKFEWITIDLEMWKGHRAYLEFSDISAPDPADDQHQKGFPPDGYLALRAIVFSDQSQAPTVTAARQERLLVPAPGDRFQTEALLDELQEAIEGAVRAWLCGESVSASQATLLDWLVTHGGLPPSPSPDAVRLATEYAQLEASIPDTVRVPSMVDGTGLDERVFLRGSHKMLGEPAPRRFLEAIAGPNQPSIQSGSGRLELARWMIDSANPFTARVMVNRVWLHLFGRGLVPTPDDFGALGQAPTDPALLDWLAAWYRTKGAWSTKRLVRMLVTSSTYRMSSRPQDANVEEKDSENLLWHRMSARRLEGEAIRDATLAVSGRLDPTLFGPPVPIHLTEFMEGRGRPAKDGPLDGAGRRSIYIEVRRNFVSPMMRAFDMPVPFSTVGRRTVSNVPAQSLILMNDPFVIGQARCWAESVLGRSDLSSEDRVRCLYETAFTRAPSATELNEALAFVQRQAAAYDAAGSKETELATWTDLCQVLFNVKEFIFVN